jgi:glycosyltransferase involved in cell wall biosynthesis
VPRVLVVTHRFPPASTSGVQRPLGFVRYLGDYGWEPVVLTVRDPVGASWDQELLSRIPPNAILIRTSWFNPRLIGKRLYLLTVKQKRFGSKEELIFAPVTSSEAVNNVRRWMNVWLLVPDGAIGWLPFAVSRGLRAIKAHNVKIIYSTSPPPTDHLIALILKRLTGLPWVADFRDLWTQSPYKDSRQRYKLRWRYSLECWLERQVLMGADHIVTVTEGLRETFLGLLSNSDTSRCQVITNGYDPAAMEGIQRQASPMFTITYTGKFYGYQRSPVAFFQALSTLLEAGIIEPGTFQVKIIGTASREIAGIVEDYGLGKIVRLLHVMPHKQALQEQTDASVLLLVVGVSPGEKDSLTGKIFEYLAARRPILGMVPQGSEVADLLHRSQAGTIVNPTDPDAIGAAIQRLYQEFKTTGDVRWQGQEEFIREFSRPRLTAKLAELFGGLARNDGRVLVR